MNTCNRCGKAVGTNDWDIHTCTPKPGLCNDCETVAHCLKHGCVPKQPRLTDDQIQEIAFVAVRDNWDWLKFARAIEAKLKEKNA